jgi:diguanylate cyclase (GGDEF)-like protein/PAS domain S-box-containing protein
MQRILVVEDERVVAWDITEALEKSGYRVVSTAASAVAALEETLKHQPDLVLMDIRLDGDQDGVTAAENIYRNLGIPVIFLTSYSDDVTLSRATATSPFGYLIKPFQVDQLHTTIQVALQRHRLEQKNKLSAEQVVDTLRSLTEATIALDLKGQITFLNPAAETLTGWTQSEAIGQPIHQILNILDGDTLAPVAESKLQSLSENIPLKLPRNCLLLNRAGVAHHIGDKSSPIMNQAGEMIGSVIVLQDVSDRKRQEEKMRRNAFYDSLTGLPNRLLFVDRLGQSLKYYKQRGQGLFGVLYLNLDRFNDINTTLGHAWGDRVLVEIGRRLTSCLRNGDTIARFGGDEFAIILQNVRDISEVELCAQRLQDQLALPIILEEHPLTLSASIGVALGQREYKRPEEVMRDADATLYQAKQAGGNCYRMIAVNA